MFEFNQEDDEINVEITCESVGAWVDGVKSAVRKQIPEQLLKVAMKLVPAMKLKDADEAKLAQAKAEAKAAEEGFKEA